jgi:ABC-three component (ABC-3C) system Middle Component 6
MILPGKHLQQDRALLGVGAEILGYLDEERTVSELWERVRSGRGPAATPLSFDWFLLALTFLYAVAAVDLTHGVISVRSRP